MPDENGGLEGREPGGGGKKSWAELLGSSLPSGLEKNILEVVLDKDVKGPFIVSDSDCARMMRKVGIDLRSGVHVEGVQICPNGRGCILITMNKEVQLQRFCRYDNFEVTSTGIRSTMVKPAGKKEVVVTMKGIHPNTRDCVVLNYLAKFGKVVTNKVVYSVFSDDGPLKGIRNGDRCYKVEIKPGENVGSYHVLEGQKVSLRYPGQQQTCGRCHETPKKCRGGGIARKCQAEGGIRVEFTEYISQLWEKIGYSPNDSELDAVMNEVDETEVEQAEGIFTPVKVPAHDVEKYAGVSITRFPKGMDNGEIIEFLCRLGLSENKKDDIIIKANGAVTVKNLNDVESRFLIESIHGKQFFDRKFFCNGIIPLTPLKQNETTPVTTAAGPASVGSASTGASPATLPGTTSAAESDVPSSTVTFSSSLTDTSTCTTSSGTGLPLASTNSSVASDLSLVQLDTSDLWTTAKPNFFYDFPTNNELVRRHSISLTNRTPPPGSIAADILKPGQSIARTKLLVNEIKDLSEQLSDFNSCIDSSSSDEADNDINSKPWTTMNEKKRNRKNKRRHSLTPNKEVFMKKVNISSEPID